MEPRQHVIVRLPLSKYDRLKNYGRRYDFSTQVILENLIDQLLAQVAPNFDESEDHDHNP